MGESSRGEMDRRAPGPLSARSAIEVIEGVVSLRIIIVVHFEERRGHSVAEGS